MSEGELRYSETVENGAHDETVVSQEKAIGFDEELDATELLEFQIEQAQSELDSISAQENHLVHADISKLMRMQRRLDGISLFLDDLEMRMKISQEKHTLAFDKNNPPIAPGERFNARISLKNLGDRPGTIDRKEEVERIKQKLNYQKYGLAQLQYTLIKYAKFYKSEGSAGDIREIADVFIDKYGLHKEHTDLFEASLDTYQKRLAIMRDIRRNWNGAGIFQELTKRRPEGKIFIEYGPVSVHLSFTNDTDFAYFYEGKQVVQNSNSIMKDSESVAGAHFVNLWEGAVTFEKLSSSEGDLSVRIHEEQHAINDLFDPLRERFFKDEVTASLVEKIRNDRWKMDNANRFIRRYYRMMMERALIKAKDEIFASFESDRFTDDYKDEGIEYTKSLFLKKASEGGLYDYFSDENDQLKDLPAHFSEHSKIRVLVKQTLQDIKSEVIDCEYPAIIDAAYHAYLKLRESSLSYVTIRGMLTTMPLDEWPRFTEDFIEQNPGIQDHIYWVR